MARLMHPALVKKYPHRALDSQLAAHAGDDQQRKANGQFGSGGGSSSGGSGHSTSGKPERKGTPSKGMTHGEMKQRLGSLMKSYSTNPAHRERAQALAKEIGKATGKSAQSVLESARKEHS